MTSFTSSVDLEIAAQGAPVTRVALSMQDADGTATLTPSETQPAATLTIPVAIRQQTPTGGILDVDGRRVAYEVVRRGDRLTLWVNGRAVEVERLTASALAARHRSGSSSPASAATDGRMVAPMPGKVLQCPVLVGDEVPENAVIAVMESMKMELTLHAPWPARVIAVAVAPGQMVAAGADLVRLEPLPVRSSEP